VQHQSRRRDRLTGELPHPAPISHFCPRFAAFCQEDRCRSRLLAATSSAALHRLSAAELRNLNGWALEKPRFGIGGCDVLLCRAGEVPQSPTKALADGETDPLMLAALADQHLRATQEQLRGALGACTELNPIYRRLLKMDASNRPFRRLGASRIGTSARLPCPGPHFRWLR
jgi:hypothetical protein